MRGWERPLDLLEAAYRLDGTDGEWMRGLVKATTKVFARGGSGAAGFCAVGRIDEEGRTVVADTGTYCGIGRALKGRDGTAFLRTYPHLPPDLQQSLFFSSETAGTISVATGLGEALRTESFWKNSGWDTSVTADSLGLKCHEGPLRMVVLGVALRKVTALTAAEQRLWQRVATHIGAASRLRHSAGKAPDAADAVLSPAGKLQHLTPGIESAPIKEGFARRRHARSRGTAAEAALEVWQGLHDGRWSLVDYVDTDGKTFVLAVRNQPAREVASTLTDRQRAAVALAALGYGNKQIAYALGLRAAAVAMLLARARVATGVQTRADLVRHFKRTLAADV